MSKLAQVRKALEGNPNISIVGAPERNYLPDRSGFFSHTVDFHVAPKSGIYTAEELQALMMSLVPGLGPTCKDDFREWDDGMEFGKLYFDEQIGTEDISRTINLTVDDAAAEGFVDGQQIVEKTLPVERRTWVRLFPDAQIASAALKGENVYRISKDDLPGKRGILSRFTG